MSIDDRKMLTDEILDELAYFFRIFGDSSRIKILYSLFQGEKRVIEISEDICLSQSAVSHQLNQLRSSRLVKTRREGKSVIYSLDDDHIFSILNQGIEHLQER